MIAAAPALRQSNRPVRNTSSKSIATGLAKRIDQRSGAESPMRKVIALPPVSGTTTSVSARCMHETTGGSIGQNTPGLDLLDTARRVGGERVVLSS